MGVARLRFASEDYTRFHWVSSPESRHSRNLAARRDVAIAIYDSSGAPGTVEAVYMSGWAEELTGDELEGGIELFDRISKEDIARAWGLSDVQPPSLFRLSRDGFGPLRPHSRPRPRARDGRRPSEPVTL